VPGHILRWLRTALLLVACSLGAAFAIAQDLQPVPALAGHVVDTSGTLDAAQRQALESRLAAFERDKGAQVVLLMVPTTLPEDITSYANRVGNEWKIGRQGIGDGLLLVVAKNDRKVRIEVAKTLEGAIPDLAAKQIIDEAITPRFRQGDFAGGLDAAAERIMALIGSEGLPAPAASGRANSDIGEWLDFIAMVFFATFLAVTIAGPLMRGLLGRKLGALAAGGGLGVLIGYFAAPWWMAAASGFAAFLAALATSRTTAPLRSRGAQQSARRRGGRSTDSWASGAGGGFFGGSSGSSSSGSSDSFSSGGGGDFGGGGASGDW
jgi:uncharacterized protein